MAALLPPLRARGLRVADPGARRWVAAVAALTLVAALLRLATLGNASLWFDEAVTLSLLRLDLGRMLAQIPHSESTPPLYYLLAWGWSRVFGVGEIAVRALSALAGIATVPVAYAAGARLATRRVGLAVAAVVAVSPVLVWHAQDARAYALLVLLCAVSLLAFARALDEPSPRRLAAWAVVAALALVTHYFAIFLIAGEAAWLLARDRSRGTALVAGTAVALVGAALVPLALRQRAHGGAAWVSDRPLPGRVGDLWPHFLAGYGAAPGPLASYESGSPLALTIAAAVLAVAALVLAAAVATRRPRGSREPPEEAREPPEEPRERHALAVAGGLALAALALPLLLALVRLDYVLTRNLLPAWLPLALIVSIGIGTRRLARIGPAVGAGLCAVLAAISVANAASPRFGPDSWASVARPLSDGPAARVVLAPASISMPLALDRPGLATLPAAGSSVEEIDVLRRGNAPRRPPAAGFVPVGRSVVGHAFTLLRFRAGSPRTVTPVELLGRNRLRRRRTAVLLAPPLAALGSRGSEPPMLRFCGPGPREHRARLSITTPCRAVYPRRRDGSRPG